ncbi:hypothetical protein ACMX25_02780 [Caballeronia sp. 15715]|uniref:hypothetical protein n=1 Tax=Caballeronia sp. LjRoot29 TaxID=3342315 RepID=UPI003ABE612B
MIRSRHFMRSRGGKKLKGKNHGLQNAAALSNNEGLQAWLLHQGDERPHALRPSPARTNG